VHEDSDFVPEQTTWGVGPWVGDLPTGPEAAIYDPELLANGDTRNVVEPSLRT